MCRSAFSSRSVLFALGLLLTAGVGTLQTTAAQQSSINLDQPVQSFEQVAVAADSNTRLVDLATTWMEARADTKISFSTYRKGVRILRRTHPDFYGNFFGDPFYATYNADYLEMARYRRRAAWKIHPSGGLSRMFFCSPTRYDPAFNGRCREGQFAALDFFFLPTGFAPRAYTAGPPASFVPKSIAFCRETYRHRPDDWCQSLAQSSREDTREDISTDRPDERPPRPDTLRQPPRTPTKVVEALDSGAQNPTSTRVPTAAIDRDSSIRVTRIHRPDPSTPQIDVPDDVHTSIQETASSLRWTERKLRLRQRIRRQYGPPQSLTPEERVRIGSEFAEERFSPSELSRAWARSRADKDARNPSRTGLSRSDRSQSRPAPAPRRPTAQDENSQDDSSTDRPSPQRREPERDTEDSGT